MFEPRHVPELLGVDDEPDGPDPPLGHFDAHDALGTAVPEVADETGSSRDDLRKWPLYILLTTLLYE